MTQKSSHLLRHGIQDVGDFVDAQYQLPLPLFNRDHHLSLVVGVEGGFCCEFYGKYATL